MDKAHKILSVLLAVAGIVIILLIRGCGDKVVVDNDQNTTITIDTVRYETVYDTAWYDTSIFKYITVKLPVPYIDTIKVYESMYSQNDFDQMMSHPSVYTDSTCKDDTVTLYYKATVRGYLDNLEIGYKIYEPYLVNKSILLHTEVEKKKRFQGIYAGLDVGVGKDGLTYTAPMIEASFRKFNYNAGFDVVDKAVVVGVRARISFRKRK